METSIEHKIEELPLGGQLAYATGMLGWSILISIVNVMLIYLYLPPTQSGLNELIPQVTILFVFNILSLIAASGRLFDAITDPLIAQFSDRSTNKLGRRIPLMRYSIIPCTVFCAMMFTPVTHHVSSSNIAWLVIMQLGFYFFLTIYNVPYNALLPELGHDSKQKLHLATYQSGAFVIGMVISSQTPLIADYVGSIFSITNRILTYQITIWGMCVFAAICLAVPAFTIDERRYCFSRPSSMPLIPAMKQTIGNRNFRLFIVADFSYFTSITIIMSGLLYYVTVLLGLPEKFGPRIIIIMVAVSLVLYPLVNALARWKGKKIFISLAFGLLAIEFTSVYFLGKIPYLPEVQGYAIGLMGAVPLAFLSILPSALLADISALDGMETGQQKEGLYYAVRSFFQKLGQTLGIMIFAILTLYGKDPGNDFGIRLTGIFGLILCLMAAVVFYRFDEEGLQKKTRIHRDRLYKRGLRWLKKEVTSRF